MRIPKPTMGAMVITAAEFWILFSDFNPNITKSGKAAADLGPGRPEGQVMTLGEYHVPGSTLLDLLFPHKYP